MKKLLLFISLLLLLNFSKINVMAKSFSEATEINPYTVSIIGDSITYEPSYATILSTNPVISATTYAIGGTRVAGKDDSLSFVNRTKGVKYNSDLILIFGGTNDYFGMGNSSQLGEPSSTDLNTFYGAYNAMLNNISKNNPNSKIVLVTPIRRIEDDKPNIYDSSGPF